VVQKRRLRRYLVCSHRFFGQYSTDTSRRRSERRQSLSFPAGEGRFPEQIPQSVEQKGDDGDPLAL